jgi:hypothetical protein
MSDGARHHAANCRNPRLAPVTRRRYVRLDESSKHGALGIRRRSAADRLRQLDHRRTQRRRRWGCPFEPRRFRGLRRVSGWGSWFARVLASRAHGLPRSRAGLRRCRSCLSAALRDVSLRRDGRPLAADVLRPRFDLAGDDSSRAAAMFHAPSRLGPHDRGKRKGAGVGVDPLRNATVKAGLESNSCALPAPARLPGRGDTVHAGSDPGGSRRPRRGRPR